MPSFHACGRSSTRERALDQRQLELEAQDDVEVVGRLVGLDADQAAVDRVDAAVERRPRSCPAGAPGRFAARRGSAQAQNGRLRPTRFSHSRLCDSCTPSETGEPSGLRAEPGGDAGLVEPVPELVQRAEERAAEVVQVVARGDADVAGARSAARTGAARRPAASRRDRSRSPSRMAITARRWSSTSCGPPNGPPAGRGASRGDAGHERHEPVRQLGEQRPQRAPSSCPARSRRAATS